MTYDSDFMYCPVRPLDYTKYKQGGGMPTTLLIGIAVVVVFLTMNSSARSSPMIAGSCGRIAGMVSAVTDNLAGKKNTKDASAVLADMPAKVADLVDASNATKENPLAAVRQMTPEQKADKEKATREWMASHEKALVMIFAHWCPACKMAMSSLSETLAKYGDMDCLLVNAEALPSTALDDSEGSIHHVQYYPTLLCKMGDKVTPINSLVELDEIVSQPAAASTKTPPAKPPVAKPPASKPSDQASLFDGLFND